MKNSVKLTHVNTSLKSITEKRRSFVLLIFYVKSRQIKSEICLLLSFHFCGSCGCGERQIEEFPEFFSGSVARSPVLSTGSLILPSEYCQPSWAKTALSPGRLTVSSKWLKPAKNKFAEDLIQVNNYEIIRDHRKLFSYQP